MWGAGVTAAVLLALIINEEVQRRRMVDQIVGTGVGLLARGEARADDRRAEFKAERDAFDRDFKQRQSDFERSFKEQGDRFDRAFEKNRVAIAGDRASKADGDATPVPAPVQ